MKNGENWRTLDDEQCIKRVHLELLPTTDDTGLPTVSPRKKKEQRPPPDRCIIVINYVKGGQLSSEPTPPLVELLRDEVNWQREQDFNFEGLSIDRLWDEIFIVFDTRMAKDKRGDQGRRLAPVHVHW